MARKPHYVEISDAIDETPTRGVERCMLIAAVRWVNFKTGEFWPSLETWASHAGFAVNTARRAVRKLQTKGLLRAIKNSKGGFTRGGRGLSATYQLLPDAGLWVPLAAEAQTADKPGRSGRKCGRSGTQTRPETTVNPAGSVAKPSKQLPVEQTTQQPQEPGIFSSAGVCLDGRTPTEEGRVRQMLTRIGVKGPKLTELLGCNLKAADVEREIADIASDPTILNPAGVLVSRLSPSSNTSRAILRSLPAEEQTLIRSLGAARQRHFRSPNATSIGSAVRRAADQWGAESQSPQSELANGAVDEDHGVD